MMWDNSDNLVSFIRHSFITCDDTGMCEAVLRSPICTGEKPGTVRVFDGKKREQDEDDANDGSSTSEHSPDIHADVGHRRRSETSRRLESLKLQRLAQSKIRTVQWKERTASTSLSSPSDVAGVRRASTSSEQGSNASQPMFAKLDEAEIKAASTARCRSSAVANLMRSRSDIPVNPFQPYVKYDGNACLTGSSRTIRVFPLMASCSLARSEPLEVCITSGAKVSDLIGLICFHYTARNLTPKLSTDISRYALYVAEDTGEVDSDLPPRSPHENVSRFHFPYFALVEAAARSPAKHADGPQSNTPKKYQVVVHTATGEQFKLEFDSMDTPLSTVRDKALEMRFSINEKWKSSMEYNMEKLSEPKCPLPLDATVAGVGTTEFMLVRAHSAGPPLPILPVPSCNTYPNSMRDTRARHSYQVTMIRKFKRDAKVQIVITHDHLEISLGNPEERKISVNSAVKLFRSFQRQLDGGRNELTAAAAERNSKTVTFQFSQIGGCEIIDEKAGRKVFRIVHKSNSYGNGAGGAGEWKSHQFECEWSVADELMQTLNGHLDSWRGDVRQEYVKRTPRKSSFFKRLQLGDLSFGEASSGSTTQS